MSPAFRRKPVPASLRKSHDSKKFAARLSGTGGDLPSEALAPRQIRVRTRPTRNPRLQSEKAEITHGNFELIAADRPLLDRINLVSRHLQRVGCVFCRPATLFANLPAPRGDSRPSNDVLGRRNCGSSRYWNGSKSQLNLT